MLVKIETLSGLRVVGLEARCVSILSPRRQPNSVIPDLWHRFVDRRSEIAGAVAGRDFGLCRMLPAGAGTSPDEFLYLAGAESGPGKVPDGMIAVDVPPGRYARFLHLGPISQLGETMHAIHEEWLPSSGHRRRDPPDLEVYGTKFKGDAADSELEICVPVE